MEVMKSAVDIWEFWLSLEKSELLDMPSLSSSFILQFAVSKTALFITQRISIARVLQPWSNRTTAAVPLPNQRINCRLQPARPVNKHLLRRQLSDFAAKTNGP
jgi:hypothetical protein